MTIPNMTFENWSTTGLTPDGGYGPADSGYTITVRGFGYRGNVHGAMEAAVRLLAAHPETQPPHPLPELRKP